MIRYLPYLLVLLAFLADVPVFYRIFIDESFSNIIAIACHVVCALLASAGIYYSLKRHGRKKTRGNIWLIYFFVVTILLPIFGLLIAIISYGIQKFVSKRPPPILTDDITVQDAIIFQKRKLRSKDLELLERTDIEPFIDILKKNETGLKRSVIRILGSMRSRQTVRNLITALQDQDIEIRLYAAGILGKLEDSFTIEIKECTTALEAEPMNEKLIYNLADIYKSYAESGLLEATAQTFYYKDCIKTLSSLKESPKRDHRIADAYFKMHDFENALKSIDRAIAAEPENSQYELLKLETLFAMKDYDDLRSKLTAAETDRLYKINSGMADFWTT